jgi:transketolase
LGSLTAGHPEYGHGHGIETTTGPLGQGVANAVGMALAERLLAARYGDNLVDHHTYAIAGDGCLMEGISQEAISLAGHLRLSKLIVLFDDNHISIDGPTSLSTSDDQLARFAASGWDISSVDGHDADAIDKAIAAAKASDRPSLIAARTTIGFGAPSKAGTSGVHGSPLGAEEIAAARAELDWPHPAFEIPDPIRTAWQAAGARGAQSRTAWEDRLSASDRGEAFSQAQTGAVPDALNTAVAKFCEQTIADRPAVATRKASQQVLEFMTEAMPALLGGSADLTGSNNTKTAATDPISAENFDGRYIYYGVREHAMAAAMNGIALHGGFVPYGGTFLTFTDYCRPSIRLSALMGLRVIYVMTHDSIGLGEDGPTHQPVEHLAALRAIPGLQVMRPADAVETAECWQAALSSQKPSVLALTRQNLPTLRVEPGENLSAKGAYVLAGGDQERAATILATGSEVEIAMQARELLAARGIAAAVVSMPTWELFEAQPEAYRLEVLGTAPRVAVEAAMPFGWSRYTGSDANVVGMPGFGASAPYEELYEHFGITAEAVASCVERAIPAA